MAEPRVLLLFLGASFALLVTPGPAVLYIVGRSADQGVRAGMVAALGLVSGGVVHVLAASVGIAALLSASPAALGALTWFGAAYLAWLGWLELRAGSDAGPAAGEPARRAGEIFRQGLLVSLLNPKAILFFLAFLPQFVRPDGADPRLQTLGLGGLFLLLALCTDTAWALVAGRVRGRLATPGRVLVRRRVSALIYFALAVGSVVPGR